MHKNSKVFLTAFVLLGFILVSQTQTKHTIVEMFRGGIVFYVSADGLLGLVSDTIVQDQIDGLAAAQIAKNGKHSVAV